MNYDCANGGRCQQLVGALVAVEFPLVHVHRNERSIEGSGNQVDHERRQQKRDQEGVDVVTNTEPSGDQDVLGPAH